MIYYKRINKALLMIQKNIEKNISMDLLSREAGFSVYHFQKIFKSVCGITVKEFIIKNRMLNSSREIVFTSAPISEIYLNYGYGSHESFSRAFKKYFGFSPNDLRKDKTLKGEIMKMSFENMFVVPNTEIPLTYEGDFKDNRWNNGFLVSPDKKYKYRVKNGIPVFDNDLDFCEEEEFILNEPWYTKHAKQHKTDIYGYIEAVYKEKSEGKYKKIKNHEQVEKFIHKALLEKGQFLEIGSGPEGGFISLFDKINSESNILLSLPYWWFLNKWKELKKDRDVLENVDFACFDIKSNPLRAGSIDCIFSWGGVSNSENHRQCIRDISRLLKPEGKVFLCVNNFHVKNSEELTDKKLKEIENAFIKEKGYDPILSEYITPYEEYLKGEGFKILMSESLWVYDVRKDQIKDIPEIFKKFGFKLTNRVYLIEAVKK